jgi:hypothetical protein
LADEEMDPVVVTELLPMVRGALRATPFADNDPVRIALEAYKFFHMVLLAPTSRTPFESGTRAVPILVTDDGKRENPSWTFTEPATTRVEYNAAAGLLEDEIDPVVSILLLPMLKGAVSVTPLAMTIPEKLPLDAYTVLQPLPDDPRSTVKLLLGTTLAPKDVETPGPRVKLLFTVSEVVSDTVE